MATQEQITLPVIGITCANCAGIIERTAQKVDGVDKAVVNVGTEKVTVTYDPATASLRTAFSRTGLFPRR